MEGGDVEISAAAGAPKAEDAADDDADATKKAAPSKQSWYSVAASTGEMPLRLARHLVSGSKRRTQTETHDLDLTYITSRIIALGLPSVGLEGLYRNPLSAVRDFLDEKHRGKYALVNLCNERDYANDDFPSAAKIFRFSFDDHHTCCMGALHTFCQQAATFLAADDEHVLCVHCKAGKGRTGVMCAAYMLFAGEQTEPDTALHFFRASRTTDLDAVNMPSQCASVRHYAQLLATPTPERASLISGPTITLHSITLSSAPSALSAMISSAVGPSSSSGSGGGSGSSTSGSGASSSSSSGSSSKFGFLPSWHLKLALYTLQEVDVVDGVRSQKTPVCSIGPTRCAPNQANIAFELPNGGLRCRGDLQLSLFSAAGIIVPADDELGWVHFHTSWLPGGAGDAAETTAGECSATFGRADVDKVSKDSRFPADWTLTLRYSRGDEAAAAVEVK